MKPINYLLVTVGMLVFASNSLTALAENVCISTPGNSLVIDITRGQEPMFVYYGMRINDSDLVIMPRPTGGNLQMYPAYGYHVHEITALSVAHADGNLSTALQVTGYTVSDDAVEAPNGVMAPSRCLRINMVDPIYATRVDLVYQAHQDCDVIETWTEITNSDVLPKGAKQLQGNKGQITLSQFASCMLPIRRGNVYLSHQHGGHNSEARVFEEPLLRGMKVIKNTDGTRGAHLDRCEVMFSLDGPARELQGDVIGAALIYSGNYRLRIDTDDTDFHYFSAGINEDNSAYHLQKGETFKTPHVALTYSNEGLSGVSRQMHKFGRQYQIANPGKLREILLNSWEGVYMDVNQEGMDQMMGDIAEMGGELFVMDDGWFGEKYRRTVDTCALGDWKVDKVKLPGGIEGLLRSAKKHHVHFGIWIEPEMTNLFAELYDAHPDWVIKSPHRELHPGRGRTQLVLDMGNPKVQDFVFSVVDDLMINYGPQSALVQSHPEEYEPITYIKWDANMEVLNAGSQYQSMDNQSHLYIDYHRGLERVLRRIRAKYPQLTIQDCASGGGRVGFSPLAWFDEFWTSDCTDALQRIYIQWGTSYFMPALGMACHISASPNHQTNRLVSLKFRTDVAMSGRLGLEIQPKNMTPAEKAQCKQAILDYKLIRPIVQLGNLYRLQSPYPGHSNVSPYSGRNLASLMYVNDQQTQAAFFWWKLETYQHEHLPRVRMAGLDPNRIYTVHELNRIDREPLACEGRQFSGAYLMQVGLDMPYAHNVEQPTSWASRVLYLESK